MAEATSSSPFSHTGGLIFCTASHLGFTKGETAVNPTAVRFEFRGWIAHPQRPGRHVPNRRWAFGPRYPFAPAHYLFIRGLEVRRCRSC